MDLNILNAANRLRLPQFKNKHGAPAHSKPDGSDWSPFMWLIAMMGEVGELADAREEADKGKEAADVLTYLDIYCQRALDSAVDNDDPDPDDHIWTENVLVKCIILLGAICEMHKKAVRGDIDVWHYETDRFPLVIDLVKKLLSLEDSIVDRTWMADPDEDGINLSEYTVSKFNEVSERVKSTVTMTRKGDAVIDRSVTGD